ncbi:MAG: threonine-phosphate decarboxylase [Syntrophomonadaceae bacterium]|nr:threonine-phosphate decarboxylase [Syntrophomonadaceae bacterium]
MANDERIHGGNVLEACIRYGFDPEDVIDFSASLSPLGIPAGVMQALQASLAAIQHYPDPECLFFRQAVASELGVGMENILAGNGAAEIIYLIVRLLLPHCALVPSPSFTEYEYAVYSAGGKIRFFPLHELDYQFVLPVESFCRSIPGTDIVFLCNPNNPTGTLVEREEMLEILRVCKKHDSMLVLDEAFLDFVDDGEGYSLVDMVPKYDNLLILKSMTKTYSLPGLRIGYAVGSKKLIRQMDKLRDPWSVNSLAQVAGTAALQEKEYLYQVKKVVRRERKFLYEEIKKQSQLKPYPPTANFLLVCIGQKGFTAGWLREMLARRGLLIRDCASFTGMGPYYFRVAVRTHPENLRLLQGLKEVLPAYPG